MTEAEHQQVHLGSSILTAESHSETAGPSRTEHLAWCKRRALEYVDNGDVHGAFASMASDLGKHQGTATHVGIQLGMLQLMGGMLSTPQEMRRFIDGFN